MRKLIQEINFKFDSNVQKIILLPTKEGGHNKNKKQRENLRLLQWYRVSSGEWVTNWVPIYRTRHVFADDNSKCNEVLVVISACKTIQTMAKCLQEMTSKNLNIQSSVYGAFGWKSKKKSLPLIYFKNKKGVLVEKKKKQWSSFMLTEPQEEVNF